MCWSWDKPIPLLPGFFPENFPPFYSFSTDMTVEEEISAVQQICAEKRSGKDASGDDAPAKQMVAPSTSISLDSLLHLRSDIRSDRERLLMDMAASRLFSLSFSVESSVGSSRYDLVTDAILWSVDFTFHLDTSVGPKQETFVVDDTSERDVLRPHINTVIVFNDIPDSITIEFEKAGRRSENAINVFFVTPHVAGINAEAGYTLINQDDTLLDVIRGKHVIDRPRFLIVLKSQSMKFLRKAQFAGSSCGPPMYSFAMHGGPPATLPPFQGMPMQPVPDMSPAGCIAQPSVQLPRGTGSSYTPEQMAEHDIAKIMSYSWTIQKKIILSFPLKRALNLFYYLRHTRRTMQQNNVMSLLPNRLQTFGVAKLPVSWKLTDRLPMMLGYKPLTGIIPINQFEIDDAADDENFEKIAMSADPQYAAHKKTKQMLELSHSEMAYWDYDMVGAASDFKEALDKMSFTRLVNLAFHLKRFPPRRNTNFTKKLKKYLFSSLDAQGVIFSARWKLDQPIPKKPRCMKVFPRVEEVFHVEHFPNYKENRTWDEIANPSEPVFPEMDCQCSYDARTDLILWSVQMKLEAFKDGVFEEGIFHIHKVYDFDSLQSILRNFVFDVASRRHSLADEFKPTIRDDGMKFIEMFMVTPILKEDKIVMLRRASVDYTLSLANAIKSTVVVDCPRFIARCKIGFDESVVEKEFADVDPPIPVLKCKEEEETPKTDAPKETSPEPKRLDILPHMETLLAKEVAFTLTPTQVAASDLEVLKGQPWDDQKFLVSVMPWDRVAALILYLRSANNDDHLKNLLILCELRLEKVGIGPIPEDWLTTHKVPTLPGYSPSMFPPFLTFGMAEVPLNAKSMFDVKNIAEELAALKDSTKLELPRLLIRFEPRSILWSVDVVFSAKTDGKSEVVRQAVQEFTGEDKVIDLFRPETTEDDMRSVDVLFAVPRIESAKFDVERYQRLKLSHSLMESLRDKVVINKPKFLIVLKEHSSVFSTKLMRANEEKALVEFYGSQRQLTQPKSTGAQFLGLFDAVHENLLRELISLREMECNTSVKSKKKAVPQPIRTQEPHLQSAPPTELPIPTSLHYGPKKILPIREMTFTEKKNIEDMVSMATHRNMEDVLKPVHSIRAVSFLSHLANFWGRIIKEDITVGTTSTRMVVFIEGLPRLITLGQSENDTVVYWRKNHDIQIPAGVAGPDLSSYPGTYFRFSEVDAPVDWAVMNAAQVCSPGPDDVLCDELPAPARYAEQEYEVGLLPPKTRNPDAQRCPVTAAENWYETIVVLPEDPLIQITARDCETRGDKTGTRFQSALNHRLIDEVSRRFKWKVVLTHRVQWESNSQFTNWFHLVDVKFENIARFYFHGHGKHISFRRAVEIAESFIMSNFCRMGIVPLEMYDLIRNFGEDWIDPVLYACRECFAAFERFARNSTFAELNSLTGAQLFMANPSAPVPILFPKAYEFARCIRDFCLRFWSEHQLVTVPKSIKIPKAELTSQFFMFEQVEGAELWDEFFSSAKDVGQYDKQKLLPVTAKLPPWEKCSDRKRKLSTPLMFDEACEEFRSNDLQEAKVKSIRQFVESLAGNIASKILIHEQKCNGEYHFEIRFSGEVGEFLHGKATATKEKAAYATAIRELYVALLNCAFVLPCMDEFLMRPYPSNIDPDEILWESSRSDCDEQLMSLVRRRNEETWRTHPVAIPLYLFFDDEDSEICRNTLQPFVQVLDPNTIWVGDVKELRSNEGEKKATLYPESSSLSIEDLAAEGTGSVKVENTVPPAVPVVTDGKKQLQMDCGAVEPLAGDQQLVIPLPWEAGIEKCQGGDPVNDYNEDDEGDEYLD
ncbi:hypothetical protein Q1695_003433 [Nippostrongylus brasiliensis]|nr:hypothetical protein Q1695_003433 [Nippostrongylus brasiliensis]